MKGLMQRQKGKRCGVDGCSKPYKAKGYCGTHYANLNRIGRPIAPQAYERHSAVRRQASDIERAYIAGYFDGEGCVQIAPRSSGGYYARVDFGQTNPTTLLLLEEIYGGSLWALAASGNRRPRTRWRLSQAASVRKFLEDVEPFVREKRGQVVAVLERFFIENPKDVQCLALDLSEMKRRSCGSDAEN